MQKITSQNFYWIYTVHRLMMSELDQFFMKKFTFSKTHVILWMDKYISTTSKLSCYGFVMIIIIIITRHRAFSMTHNNAQVKLDKPNLTTSAPTQHGENICNFQWHKWISSGNEDKVS